MIVSNDVYQAVSELVNGKVIAIPTETVYGLAANIFDENAVRKIFELKERPLTNPLIVHIGSISQIERLIKGTFPKQFKMLATSFWPGPLTFLFDKNNEVPNLITANSDRVAIRMPSHPLLLKLLNKIEFPLATPSANPYKRISSTEVGHVSKYFEGKLDFTLDGGKCDIGIESTIIGLEDGNVVIYRKGGISKCQLEAVLKTEVYYKSVKGSQLPGSALKHYAPSKKLIVTDDINKIVLINDSKRIGVIQFSDNLLAEEVKFKLSFRGDYEDASRNLFNYLHFLEQQDIDLIVCEKFPDKGIGVALNDRILRASSK